MAEGKEISEITGRSKFFFANTMLCLLKVLEGKKITIEIRNDYTIEGKLLMVDSSMGLTMSRVVLTNAKGQSTHFEFFHIQGRQIRYVHIPDEINIVDAMTRQLNKVNIQQEKERRNKGKLFFQKKQRSEQAFQRRQKQENKGKRKQ